MDLGVKKGAVLNSLDDALDGTAKELSDAALSSARSFPVCNNLQSCLPALGLIL